MLVSPQNSYADFLIYKMVVLGGVAFGSWLGQEGRDPANRISALKREALDTNLSCFDHMEASGILL